MPPRTPLLQPGEYFDQYDRPSLGVAAGIVAVQAVAVAVLVWWFVTSVLDRIDAPEAAVSNVRGERVGQAIFLAVMVVVGWLLAAAVIHVFVWFADGDETFLTTLAVVGEAELVSLLVLPVVVVVFYSVIGQVPSDPEAAAEFLRGIVGRERAPLVVASLVATLWKAYITAAGLVKGQGLDSDKAFLIAFALGILGFLVGLA